MKLKRFLPPLLGLLTATTLFAEDSLDARHYDWRMAEANAVQEGNVKWIDGKYLPLEGKAFTNVTRFYDRLPATVTTNVNQGVRAMRSHSAGLQFRFSVDSGDQLLFRWTPLNPHLAMDHMPASGVSGIDVYTRKPGEAWRYKATGRIEKSSGGELKIPYEPNLECLVNLPLYNGIKDFTLGVATSAVVRALPPRANGINLPVVFYGTSITHGGCASRPGLAFVNIVGRDLDVPVVNLGFSGCGVMEFEMSEHLAAIDASCYVLDCLWNMRLPMVQARYENFIRNLRQKRPNVPIVMAGMCTIGKPFNEKDRATYELYQKLIAEGWQGLYWLPPDGMLVNNREDTVDGVHPNDLGMMSMAKAYGEAIRTALKLPPTTAQQK